MSNSRKNGSPLLREVLFKTPAPVNKPTQPVLKNRKSLDEMDQMFKHPRSNPEITQNPKFAHLFPAKVVVKNTPVTDETDTPTPKHP